MRPVDFDCVVLHFSTALIAAAVVIAKQMCRGHIATGAACSFDGLVHESCALRVLIRVTSQCVLNLIPVVTLIHRACMRPFS
mmetsp:Transcript_24904/g.54404  ORF Transcript_24904/g.54404 Transcript_24904/m.54404 type:complete len:82 (-) Transcript_24904:47-292(-)